jgi:hypothetical protein
MRLIINYYHQHINKFKLVVFVVMGDARIFVVVENRPEQYFAAHIVPGC